MRPCHSSVQIAAPKRKKYREDSRSCKTGGIIISVFVCDDDETRENGSPEKAQKVYDLCAENGWVPISMKNDWLTVFGDGVTKKP